MLAPRNVWKHNIGSDMATTMLVIQIQDQPIFRACRVKLSHTLENSTMSPAPVCIGYTEGPWQGMAKPPNPRKAPVPAPVQAPVVRRVSLSGWLG
jgi:hypothetical protein